MSAVKSYRCYLDPRHWGAPTARLSPEESHHMRHVLRVAPGDELIAIDGAGREANARVLAADADGITLALSGERETPRAGVALTLVQALPRSKHMDWIVQKATELGAAAIEPVIAARSLVRLDAAQAADKRERWQRIARESAKQCGNGVLPEVGLPMPFAAWLALGRRHDLVLLASLDPDARALRELLAERGRAARSVAIIIGPEGDLTPGEISDARGAGALALSLGPLTLRVETAALVALSILGYEFGGPKS